MIHLVTRGRNNKQKKKSLHGLWDTISGINPCIIEISEEGGGGRGGGGERGKEDGKKGTESLFKERVAEGTDKILVKEQTSDIKNLAEGSMNPH